VELRDGLRLAAAGLECPARQPKCRSPPRLPSSQLERRFCDEPDESGRDRSLGAPARGELSAAGSPATTASMSSTTNAMRRIPRVFAGVIHDQLAHRRRSLGGPHRRVLNESDAQTSAPPALEFRRIVDARLLAQHALGIELRGWSVTLEPRPLVRAEHEFGRS
jgi:hypothetical protein